MMFLWIDQTFQNFRTLYKPFLLLFMVSRKMKNSVQLLNTGTQYFYPGQVSELESQIDNFEAEVEGLSVKKGKQRPPRLVSSIVL